MADGPQKVSARTVDLRDPRQLEECLEPAGGPSPESTGRDVRASGAAAQPALPAPTVRSGTALWRHGVTLEHWLRDGRNRFYRVRVEYESPRASCGDLRTSLDVIERLNGLMARPVTAFKFQDGSRTGVLGERHASGTYRGFLHDIHAVRNDPETLVHELGHGIYDKQFKRDADWQAIYRFALAWKNYLILGGAGFHLVKNPHELFASAVELFFRGTADFEKWLLNPGMPETSRLFGKLVWCFLRDRVFKGRVFTRDGKDPFAGERHQHLLAALKRRWHETVAVRGRHPADDSVTHLMVGLMDAVNDKKDALSALGAIGRPAIRAVPAIVPLLRDPNGEVRSLASEALPKIIPSRRVRARAIDIFGGKGPALTAALRRALEEKDRDLRALAALKLIEVDPSSANAAHALIAHLLAHPSAAMRQAVAAAMLHPGRRSRVSKAALVVTLNDRDADVRGEALGRIPIMAIAPDRELVAFLKDLLGDRDLPSQRVAARSLLMIALTARHSMAVRGAAISALLTARANGEERARVKGRDAVPALLLALKDADRSVRAAAAEALGAIGWASKEILSALTAALRDPDHEVRRAAASALRDLGAPSPEADPAVTAALRGAEEALRLFGR